MLINLSILGFALLESLAFVGVLFPGAGPLMITIGLAGTERMSVLLVILFGVLGSMTGDIISFYLGKYSNALINKRVAGNKIKSAINQAQTFFKKYGLYAIFLGKFFGPVRAFIPFLVGTTNNPVRNFIIISLASGIVWIASLTIPIYYGTQFIATYGEHWLRTLKSVPSYIYILLGIIITLVVILFLKRKKNVNKE